MQSTLELTEIDSSLKNKKKQCSEFRCGIRRLSSKYAASLMRSLFITDMHKKCSLNAKLKHFFTGFEFYETDKKKTKDFCPSIKIHKFEWHEFLKVNQQKQLKRNNRKLCSF